MRSLATDHGSCSLMCYFIGYRNAGDGAVEGQDPVADSGQDTELGTCYPINTTPHLPSPLALHLAGQRIHSTPYLRPFSGAHFTGLHVPLALRVLRTISIYHSDDTRLRLSVFSLHFRALRARTPQHVQLSSRSGPSLPHTTLDSFALVCRLPSLRDLHAPSLPYRFRTELGRCLRVIRVLCVMDQTRSPLFQYVVHSPDELHSQRPQSPSYLTHPTIPTSVPRTCTRERSRNDVNCQAAPQCLVFPPVSPRALVILCALRTSRLASWEAHGGLLSTRALGSVVGKLELGLRKWGNTG